MFDKLQCEVLFSLVSHSVQYLSTVERFNCKLHGMETGIVTIPGSIVALRYIETSSMLVMKHWYS